MSGQARWPLATGFCRSVLAPEHGSLAQTQKPGLDWVYGNSPEGSNRRSWAKNGGVGWEGVGMMLDSLGGFRCSENGVQQPCGQRLMAAQEL